MPTQDVRWQQRFSNFMKALSQLETAVSLATQRPLTPLEQQGLIQAFEYTHELAWKTLKDFLESRGGEKMYGSKDVTRRAFQVGLIEDGSVWMKMIASRNLTSHTYNEETAVSIATAIIEEYITEFVALRQQLTQIKQADE